MDIPRLAWLGLNSIPLRNCITDRPSFFFIGQWCWWKRLLDQIFSTSRGYCFFLLNAVVNSSKADFSFLLFYFLLCLARGRLNWAGQLDLLWMYVFKTSV
jgi:hypothetical protein